MSRGPRVTTSNRYGERRGSADDLGRKIERRRKKEGKPPVDVDEVFRSLDRIRKKILG